MPCPRPPGPHRVASLDKDDLLAVLVDAAGSGVGEDQRERRRVRDLQPCRAAVQGQPAMDSDPTGGGTATATVATRVTEASPSR